MSYSLLIIEDELAGRKGLHKFMKAFPSIDLLPDAVDGMEGIEFIKRYDPDIVFLDIQMPRMDGLAALRYLRSGGYDGEIVIYTAYDRFDYAQQALNAGANAFLVKPEKEETLRQVLKDCLSRIDARRVRKQTNVQQATSLAGMTDYIAKNIVWCACEHRPISSELMAQLLELNISFSSGFFINAGVRPEDLNRLAETEIEKSEIMVRIRNIIRTSVQVEARCITAPAYGRQVAVFLSSASLRSMMWYRYVVSEVVRQIQEALRDAMRITVRIGVGSVKDTIDEYYASYLESLQALYATNDKSTVHMKTQSEVVRFHGYLKALHQFSAVSDTQKTYMFLKGQIERLSKDCAELPFYEAQGMFLTYWLEVLHLFQPNHVITDDLNGEIEATTTMESLTGLFIRKIRELQHAEEAPQSYSRIISAALKIINKTYLQDMSLDELADELQITPSYLSFLFKKEVGKTFSDYILDLRLQELEKLLDSSAEYTVQEYAERLGYRDSGYFCRVVKKATGKTISQLRKEHLQSH